MKKKCFVAMSGGVDSSVAAALLKNLPAGRHGKYDVTGVHIKGYNVDGCGEKEAEDARRAAEVLGIPFYVFDLEREYKNKVVDYMIEGYKKGITPNPDVMCNKEIKFGLFLKKALTLGADYIATGHYVKLSRIIQPIFSLYAAKDKNKDQSYFLWTLTQKQLKYCLFPLGDLTKPEVRKIAKKFNLPNANKKDSQGVCFLGKVNVKNFLAKYIPPKKGIVLNTEGKIVGEHEGAQFYTIGQRHIGIIGKSQIANRKSPNKKPYYVAEKDIKSNALLVAEGENNPVLYTKEVKLKNVNFINSLPSLIRANKRIDREIKVMMRVRYRQPLFSGVLKIGKGIKAIFDKPQRFVAQGQSAVFYLPGRGGKKGEMLGGGIIC